MAIERKYGIDVSYHQGVIDWQAVKDSGVYWVIIRAGYGFSTVDTQFVANITGAVAAGIENIGIYWFSYAHNEDDIAVEVASCLSAIDPYSESINLPVFFDFESASYTYVQNTYGVSLTASQIQDLSVAWCESVRAAGYNAGIYANKNDADRWFKMQSDLYIWEYLNCEFWYARYGANDETELFIVPAFEQTAYSEHPEMSILQYSDVGRINGINSQRVDLNIRYVETPDPPTPPEPTPPIIRDEPHNAIDYVEIRGVTMEVDGIIDTASSVIWHSVYFGVGDFEIYVQMRPHILNLLQVGNYVTRPDSREIGIIEKIEISNDIEKGTMITATGRFAKSILDRRLIYNLYSTTNTPTILSGNVETAVRNTVSSNAISCSFDSSRNIPSVVLGAAAGISKTIVDDNGNAAQKQVSYQNLLEYTDKVLEEYGLSAYMALDESTQKLQYIVFDGIDRSADNTSGNHPIVFSREFDNLSSTDYQFDESNEKNVALIGGEGEGLERFYSLLGTKSGLNRRETWVDASSINRTYNDENDVEQTYTIFEYRAMLNAQGKQELSVLIPTESFSGVIDITNGNYLYNRDFFLGDIVTVQDNEINKYIDVRIRDVTEVQDENGYSIEAKYE